MAQLNPAVYGKEIFKELIYSPDTVWRYTEDSVGVLWYTDAVSKSTWKEAEMLSMDFFKHPVYGSIPRVGSKKSGKKILLWGTTYIPGIPKTARLYLEKALVQSFYCNEKLLYTYTADSDSGSGIDSIISIESLLKGGKNSFSCECIPDSDSVSGAAFKLVVLLDTINQSLTTINQHRSITPVNDSVPTRKTHQRISNVILDTSFQKDPTKKIPSSISTQAHPTQYTQKTVSDSISFYNQRLKSVQADIRKENLAILKLKIMLDRINERIKESTLRNKSNENGNATIY